MNRELIEQAQIPDMAFVYGGVRGRTMSSSRQAHAWKALVEGGIRQVIDLREDYHNDKYENVCKSHGVDYFRYPVCRKSECVAIMVEKFPELCELIDKGDFFISCAQGLHRTDIALCLYWVFHAADEGKEPPVLRGYLQEKGHGTGKIFHVLNLFYSYMTEKNGACPMPIEVFKDRKGIIQSTCADNSA